MTDRVLPDADTVAAALASHEGPWGAGAHVLSVRDLSTGLGQAAVLRASIATPYACPSLWIVKILGWGHQTLLDSRDRLLDRREAHFYGSSVPDLLPRGLTTPSGATVFRHHDRTWIVMRDVAAVLQQSWTPDAAMTAARRTALLCLPAALRPSLLDAPWLEQDGYAAYAHHVPAGHDNLDALADDPRLRTLFTPEQTKALHACLDASDELSARAKGLPATLVHGDLTPRNAGLDPHGALALIDWEHVGVGPVGYDLGTFVSLYRAFGGHGELDEPALLEVYGRAVSELAGTDLRPAAALGFATAHLTWGIHLRLGPGLTAVRQGLNRDAPAALAAHLDDIRSGCLRALSWAAAA
ncbi:phosphotransferase family protein [Promicromonospora panici]|uniref:phosphotransferase family protein n=1 Tax=Promicromonospora panici TaxID=2219658 RepID=UPI0013EDC612|nr:phosphotransferase [Promicromonospora panici]